MSPVAVSFDDDIIAASQTIIGQVHALDSLGQRGPILSFNVSPGPTKKCWCYRNIKFGYQAIPGLTRRAAPM
ncbi:hypothetical protein ASG68_19025 [Rhizobium sp. Leaf453]|nr:hypothetical protein ASG42_28840 [Rhizobium sp. Leaf391]KQS99065.1 hypothetical protein ASG50_20335 [Rhizobium sp. Leaf386]KQT91903.1 hypothetical protein ASG68_19025 [Rhizobium sp. Leaf453]